MIGKVGLFCAQLRDYIFFDIVRTIPFWDCD